MLLFSTLLSDFGERKFTSSSCWLIVDFEGKREVYRIQFGLLCYAYKHFPNNLSRLIKDDDEDHKVK